MTVKKVLPMIGRIGIVIYSLFFVTVVWFSIVGAYQKLRCHRAIDLSIRTYVQVAAPKDPIWNPFNGPTECKVSLGYWIKGRGLIWVTPTGISPYIYTGGGQIPASFMERVEAKIWANQVLATVDAKDFTYQIP